jgi:hypothetical protein
MEGAQIGVSASIGIRTGRGRVRSGEVKGGSLPALEGVGVWASGERDRVSTVL